MVFSWGGKTCCPVSLEITYFRLHVPVTLLWCGSSYVSRVVKFPNIGQNIVFFNRASIPWYKCTTTMDLPLPCVSGNNLLSFTCSCNPLVVWFSLCQQGCEVSKQVSHTSPIHLVQDFESLHLILPFQFFS